MNTRYVLLFLTGLFSLVMTADLHAETTLKDRMRAAQNEVGGSRGLDILHVENDHAAFAIHVDVDKKDRIYREGDLLVASVKSSHSGYLYMIHVSANGKETLLIPNKYHIVNKVEANRTVLYPEKQFHFKFRVSAPFGREVIKAFVTKKPLHSIDTAKFTQSAATSLDGVTSNSIATELGKRSKDILIEGANNDFATHEVVYTSRARYGASQRSPRPREPRRCAVCIGIESYLDPNIKNLSVPRMDAKAMAALFQKYCGVKAGNCLVLTDNEATLSNLRRVFCDVLPKELQPGDVLFLYWSGHGGRMAAIAGSSSTTGFTQYLVPHDGKLNNPVETMLLDDQFGIWMQKFSGCKIFFALDTCHAGGMTIRAKSIANEAAPRSDFESNGGSLVARFRDSDDKSKAVDDVPAKDEEDFIDFTFGFTSFARAKALGQDGMAILASSSYNQLSYEREEEDLSIMTHCLIKAIIDGPNDMTHKDLKAKVRVGVDDYIKRNRPHTKQTVVEQDDLTPGLRLKP